MHDMGREYTLCVDESLFGHHACDDIHFWNFPVKPIVTLLINGKQGAVFQRLQGLFTGSLGKEALITTCEMIFLVYKYRCFFVLHIHTVKPHKTLYYKINIC